MRSYLSFLLIPLFVRPGVDPHDDLARCQRELALRHGARRCSTFETPWVAGECMHNRGICVHKF